MMGGEGARFICRTSVRRVMYVWRLALIYYGMANVSCEVHGWSTGRVQYPLHHAVCFFLGLLGRFAVSCCKCLSWN
jgi:hypothetical protein